MTISSCLDQRTKGFLLEFSSAFKKRIKRELTRIKELKRRKDSEKESKSQSFKFQSGAFDDAELPMTKLTLSQGIGNWGRGYVHTG